MDYREYLLQGIRRMEEKLSSMTDPARISVAKHNLKEARRAYRRGIPKETSNSIGLSVSVVVE